MTKKQEGEWERMQAGIKTERQSNMELLRIFAVAGVIVLHFNAKALPAASGATRWALFLLEMVSACAVNVFVMLSGYFLHRRQSVSIYKPLSLLFQHTLPVLRHIFCMRRPPGRFEALF